MPAANKPKHAGGRPSLYKPKEHCRLAFAMGLIGATDVQIAKAIGVSRNKFSKWKKVHPEFGNTLKESREQADAQVTKSLYHRAIGYEHKAVKIVADAKTGASTSVPYTERYPPDPVACIFWLKNRRPDLWREKSTEVHVSQSNSNVVNVLPPEIVKRAREIFERETNGAQRQ